MKKLAYIDSADILHISKDRATAERCVKKIRDENDKIIKMWPIVETDFPAKDGYPINEDGNNYTIYSETEERHSYEIPDKLVELYKKVK